MEEKKAMFLLRIAIIICSIGLLLSCKAFQPRSCTIDGMKMKQTKYGYVHDFQIKGIKEVKKRL